MKTSGVKVHDEKYAYVYVNRLVVVPGKTKIYELRCLRCLKEWNLQTIATWEVAMRMIEISEDLYRFLRGFPRSWRVRNLKPRL